MKLIASFESSSRVQRFSEKDYFLCMPEGGEKIILKRKWQMNGESWKRVSEVPMTIKGYNPKLLGEIDEDNTRIT